MQLRDDGVRVVEIRLHHDLGIRRFFVRRVDPGEILDLPGLRFLVEPPGIPPLAHVQVTLDEDLGEGSVGKNAPHESPVVAEGGNERADHDVALLVEELGRLSDPPDVLGPILVAEP